MTEQEKRWVFDQILAMASYLREVCSFQRREDLRAALADPEQVRAYELSDGKRTSEEIRKAGEISKSARTIRRWWREWVEGGLASEVEGGGVRARYDTFVLRAGAPSVE